MRFRPGKVNIYSCLLFAMLRIMCFGPQCWVPMGQPNGTLKGVPSCRAVLGGTGQLGPRLGDGSAVRPGGPDPRRRGRDPGFTAPFTATGRRAPGCGRRRARGRALVGSRHVGARRMVERRLAAWLGPGLGESGRLGGNRWSKFAFGFDGLALCRFKWCELGGVGPSPIQVVHLCSKYRLLVGSSGSNMDHSNRTWPDACDKG